MTATTMAPRPVTPRRDQAATGEPETRDESERYALGVDEDLDQRAAA